MLLKTKQKDEVLKGVKKCILTLISFSCQSFSVLANFPAELNSCIAIDTVCIVNIHAVMYYVFMYM